MVDEKKMYDDTKALFDKLEIDVDPKRIMSTMPVSQRQMAEIAKAVSFNSKIIRVRRANIFPDGRRGRALVQNYKYAERSGMWYHLHLP